MKIVRVAFRSFNDCLSHRLQRQNIVRNLSTNAAASGIDDEQGSNSFESTDEFEQRIFGGSKSGGSNSDAFFRSLDRLSSVRDRAASKFNGWNSSETMDGLDESFSTIEDGMDGKLKKAATYFEHDTEEIMKEDYSFRPDMTFRQGMTYETKDLDLTKPGVRKPFKKWEFEVTTEEVLRKADFRNVRFLANFITEAGIIIKRSQTRISAKAQRKVAREIKTARAFGLMPFTTMGTKPFAFGKTMENLDCDYEYETYDGHEPDAQG